MNQRIKLFLSSSNDLSEERKKLGSFFQQYNQGNQDKDLFWDLLLWEKMSKEWVDGGIQLNFDEELKNSHFVLVLVYSKIGVFTKKEFELAIELLRDNKSTLQKLVVGFKVSEMVPNSIQALKEALAVAEFKEIIEDRGNSYFEFKNDAELEKNCSLEMDSFSKRYFSDQVFRDLLDPKQPEEQIKVRLEPKYKFPAVTSSFTGREEELYQVLDNLLGNHPAYLIGVRGQGGIGKSELAKEVCNIVRLKNEGGCVINQNQNIVNLLSNHETMFTDGILWLRVEKERSLDQVIQEQVIPRLQVEGANKSELDSTKISERLNQQDLLLVIDSAEQNTGVYEQLISLFDNSVRIVTSRKALTLERIIDVGAMEQDQSQELFRKVLGSTLSTKEEICLPLLLEEVGRLPLMIQILAHRAKRKRNTITLDSIFNQLQTAKATSSRFLKELEGNIIQDNVPQFASMVASFKMSWNDLTLDAKNLLMLTSAFAHPFSITDLQAVYEEGDDEGIPKMDLANSFEELADWYLIEPIDQNREYFSLHPMIEQCALKQLDDAGQTHEVLKALQIRYLKLAKSVRFSEFQISEIYSIMDRCQKSDNDTTLLDYIKALQKYWYDRGSWRELLKWNKKGMTIAEQRDQKEDMLFLLERYSDILHRTGKYEEARAGLLATSEKQNTNEIKGFYPYYLYLSGFSSQDQNIPDFVYSSMLSCRQALLKEKIFEAFDFFYRSIFNHKCSFGQNKRDFSFFKQRLFRQQNKENNPSAFELLDIVTYYNELEQYDNLAQPVELLLEQAQSGSWIVTRSLARYSIPFFIFKQQWEQVEHQIKQATEIYQLTDNRSALIDVSFYKVNYLLSQNKIDLAQESLRENKNSTLSQKKYFFYWQGRIHLTKGLCKEAIENFDRAISISKELENTFSTKDSLAYLAWAQAKLGQKSESLNSLHKAQSIADTCNCSHSHRLAEAKNGVFKELGESGQLEFEAMATLPPVEMPDFLLSNLQESITGEDNKKMLLVPEGQISGQETPISDDSLYELVLKTDYGPKDKIFLEKWKDNHYLYSFYIDAEPVTQQEYRDYCKNTGKDLPAKLADLEVITGRQPYYFSDPQEAKNYASHFKKLVPLPEEWQRAQGYFVPASIWDTLETGEIKSLWKDFQKDAYGSQRDLRSQYEWLQGNPPSFKHDWVLLLCGTEDFSTNLEQSEKEKIIRGLAGSISLSRDEKKSVIEALPALTRFQIDELLKVFANEITGFQELTPEHNDYLNLSHERSQTDMYRLLIELQTDDFSKMPSPLYEYIFSPSGLELTERDTEWMINQNALASKDWDRKSDQTRLKVPVEGTSQKEFAPFALRCIVPAATLIKNAKML